jgi:hypothetical protein
MTTTTTTAKRSDCARRTAHSLDELAGYVVVRTVVAHEAADPQGQGAGEVLAILEGSSRYLEALAIAKAARTGGDYAIVRDLSDCPVCDPITLAGRVAHFELA